MAFPVVALAEVRIDVDRHKDFSQYRNAVTSELLARGLEPTDESPSLIVRVSGRDSERVSVTSTAPVYPRYYWRRRSASGMRYSAAMRRLLIVLAVAFSSQAAVLWQLDQPLAELLRIHQFDLATEGKALLEKEARAASFFLIGGLHGDKETPALVDALWPIVGYQYLAAEMSPWAASRLKVGHLRGSDIEELQPHSLIRALAEANPQNQTLRSMVALTKDGYKRALASQLLESARGMGDVKDSTPGGISLRQQVLRTLEVETERANRKGNDRLLASMRREAVMKEFFLAHYRAAGGKPKVMAVFGQNHLHRGIDRRGVSTLGNFIAELAIAEGVESFHVVLFAAGGKINLFGLQDLDQRKDDPALGVLAAAARYPATLFDLRPIRRALHQIPLDKLSPSDSGLVYWADSYDAIVCYREVTPAD